jgi:hypothetical protein
MGMSGKMRAEGGEEMGGGMRLLVPRLKKGGHLVVGVFLYQVPESACRDG